MRDGGPAPGDAASAVDHDEHQLALDSHLTIEERATARLAGTRRHPQHLDLELERVARGDLPPEPGPVDSPEQG